MDRLYLRRQLLDGELSKAIVSLGKRHECTMMTWVDAACTFLLLLLNKSYVMLQNGCLNIFITSKTSTVQAIGKIFFRQPTSLGVFV
jgi:hypothetical protein